MPGVMPWVKPSTPCGSRRKSNTCFNIHNSMTENAIEFFLCLQKHKKPPAFSADGQEGTSIRVSDRSLQ